MTFTTSSTPPRAALAAPSGAGYAAVPRLDPVRDAADLRRLIVLVERIRRKRIATGADTGVADDVLTALRHELRQLAPPDAA